MRKCIHALCVSIMCILLLCIVSSSVRSRVRGSCVFFQLVSGWLIVYFTAWLCFSKDG